MNHSPATQLHVLFIDDNYWQLKVHQVVLEQAGYLVESAISAKTAWKCIRHSLPDIIILDRVLPDTDGIQLCQQIKAAYPTTLIIMFSGFKIGEADRIGGLNAGADDYLIKPVSPHELLARVNAAARLRQLQLRLEESERQYRLLAENVTDVIGQVAYEGHFLYVSPASEKLVGCAPEEIIGTPLEAWVHPQDQELVDSMGQLAVQEKRYPKFECRVKHKDGHYTWVEVTMRAMGSTHDLIFVARDIHKRKEAEAQLHLLSSALTAAANAVIIFDSDGIIQWTNPAFTSLTGYTREEAVGKKLDLLESGRHSPAFFKQLWQTISSGKVWHGEIVNHRKNGAEYVEEVTITPLKDENGLVHQYIEIKQDVTQAKRAQEALRESEGRYRALVENLPDMIFRYDTQGRHAYVSPNVKTIFGDGAEAFLGKQFSDLQVKPETAVHWQSLIQQVLDTGESQEEEFYYDGVRGNYYLNVRLVPEHDSEGRITAVLAIVRNLTTRKETENQLARLAALVEQATEITIVVNDAGEVTYVNPYYTALTGQPADAILGQPVSQINGLFRQNDLDQIVQDTLTTGRSWRGQLSTHPPDIPVHYFDTDVFPITALDRHTANIGIVMRDVTDRVERLREHEAIAHTASALRRAVTRAEMVPAILHEIQSLLKATGVALVQQIPESGAPTIERAVGTDVFTAGKWLPTLTDLQPQTTTPQPYVNNDVLASLDPAGQELVVPLTAVISLRLAVQENHLGVLWIGRQSPFQDQEIQLLLAVADIAANALYRAALFDQLQRQAEELAQRVDERTADLTIANTRLSKALRSRDEFLASMSHELRTPLSAILMRSELMESDIYGTLNEKQARSIKVIHSSGEHLLALINDILDVAKIEAGKLTLEIKTVSIQEACQTSLLLVQQLAQQKNITLKLQIDPELTSIRADALRLKQILVNLLSNAVKFTPDQGEVSLTVFQDANTETVSFTVSDTGIGIPNKDIPELFKAFTQVDSSLARKYEGTGLGLALVRHLVELHGGGIFIQSVVDEGTQITFRLPTKESIDMNRVESFATTNCTQASQSKRVLLAEDNEYAIEALTEYISNLGFEVFLARNGVEALTQIKRVHPHLVIMDIQMPDMDGLEAVRRIRKSGAASPQLPIIALTALAMPGDRERCLEAGATAYMAKPFALRELTDLLCTLIEETAVSQTA